MLYLTPQQTLRVAMVLEVVGEDGTFALENISYQLDAGAGNTMTNYTGTYHQAEAVFANPGLAAPAAAAATIAQPKSGASIVRASFVDSKLVLGGRFTTTGTAKFGDKGFASYFGLNDAVEKDADGKWKVVDRITEDPRHLALAKPRKQPNVNVTTLAGVNAAAAQLSFVGGMPADTETITINGQLFRFMYVPVNANDIQRAPAGPQQGQQTILNAITLINSETFPNVSDLVTASVNGGNALIMDLTAKNAGSKGNAIAFTGVGGHAWNNTANPCGGAVFLDNGTDAVGATTRSAASFAFEIVATDNANALKALNAIKFSDGTVKTLKAALMKNQMLIAEAMESYEGESKEATAVKVILP